MLTKPTIKLDLENKSNAVLLVFCQTLASMLSGNPLFTTPTNPTLIQFGTLITAFSDALTAWGTVGNRGSHVEQLAVETTRRDLEIGVYGLATYCSNTQPYSASALSSAGFELKSEANPVGVLAAVRDFRQVVDRVINYNKVKVAWRRPLDTPKGAIKAFNLYRSGTPVFGSATLLATITKTSYVDEELTNPNYYYWVIPINAAGSGRVERHFNGYRVPATGLAFNDEIKLKIGGFCWEKNSIFNF